MLSTVVDIFLVALVVYWLIVLSKRTRAWQVIWGLVIFFILVFVTELLELHTINYLLDSLLPLGPVAIVILFYPELRHALENMGRFAGWGRGMSSIGREEISDVIQTLVKATTWMSERNIGALIVIERETTLDDIAETGTPLEAEVSSELIMSIFFPGNPLHDGAIILRGKQIVAGGCTLPLSESANVGTMIHTRHKAALGIAEISDAAVVVVSEETGTISLAFEGKLHRGLDGENLARWLRNVTVTTGRKVTDSKLARGIGETFRKSEQKDDVS